jgi:enamine deaminase RidA (YjgF/YER057c/UK114 family)
MTATDHLVPSRMTHAARRYVPFSSLWKMRIDHPYSLVVRDGAVAWSCGQCPLDMDGRVCSPGDLAAQTRCIVPFIRTGMDGVGLSPDSIGKLVVYFVDVGVRERQQMLSILRSAFGDIPLILPLAVPHFYYDGMLIEVDVHAAAGTPVRVEGDSPGIVLEGVVGEDLAWVNVMIARDTLDSGSTSLADCIESSLAGFGIGTGDLLSDHWFVGQHAAHAAFDILVRDGLIGDRGAMVQVGLPGGLSLVGELTFSRRGGVRSASIVQRSVSDHEAVTVRRHGGYFWISGRANTPDQGLVDQTRSAMRAINTAMLEQGWRFDRVCKATTHYIGDSSAEELHANMAVRNNYYQPPGPASTGLPVMAFSCSASLVTVDVLGTVETS